VERAIHEIYRNIHHAMLIWLGLVALTVVGCGLIAVPALYRWYRAGKARSMAGRLRRVTLGAQAAELRRLADEVTVAAERSRVTAQRRHEEWEAVCRARQRAWQSLAAADEAAGRAGRAAAFPLEVPQAVPDPRARERYLHRVCTEAYRRGELSFADLGAVFSHRGDWQPQCHPADQEVALRRIKRDRLRSAYQAVATLEQAARQQAETADWAARSLQAEAVATAARARWAEQACAAGQTRIAVGRLATS
jgi:hypothetical protein